MGLAEKVARVDYEGPEGEIILQKKKGNWKFKGPGDHDLKQEEVKGLLDVLTGLEAVRFMDRTSLEADGGGGSGVPGLEPPERMFTLKGDEGEELGVLLLSGMGPEGEEGLFFAGWKGDRWVGLVEEARKKELVEKVAQFFKEG